MSSQERTSAASLPNACDPQAQQARQDALDAAYEADPRATDPTHPQHALYTGLVAAQQEACLLSAPAPTIEDQLAAWWRSSYPNASLNAQTGQMMCAFGAWLLEQREQAQ